MTNWIPVTEKLPEDNRPVLMTEKGRTWPVRGYYDDNFDCWFTETRAITEGITAWMELPPVYRPIEEDVW